MGPAHSAGPGPCAVCIALPGEAPPWSGQVPGRAGPRTVPHPYITIRKIPCAKPPTASLVVVKPMIIHVSLSRVSENAEHSENGEGNQGGLARHRTLLWDRE